MQGDYQQAVSYLEEVVAIERDIGSRARRGRALIDLAITARHCGDHARAATLWNEALPLHEELDNAYSLAVCLTGLAGLQAQPMRTTQVLAAAHTAFKASTEAIDPHYRAEHEQLTKAARNALSDESFAAAWANGCAMSPQQAIAYARVGLEASPPGDKSASAYSPSQPVKQRFGGLTKREREVAALVALGKSNREIAETLVVSEYTVASHVSNILSKLEFSSRTQIVGWAIEKGLARLPSS
jgi:non-specific serine/threonine protein kinase